MAGKQIEAGLPNIVGTFYQDINCRFNNSGSFTYVFGSSINLANGDNYSSGYVEFDASRSNSIYGASDTVQPPAVTVRYFIKAQ